MALPFALFAVLPIHRQWLRFCPFALNDFPFVAATFRSQDVLPRSWWEKKATKQFIYDIRFIKTKYRMYVRVLTVANRRAYLLIAIYAAKHFATFHPNVHVIDLLQRKKKEKFINLWFSLFYEK